MNTKKTFKLYVPQENEYLTNWTLLVAKEISEKLGSDPSAVLTDEELTDIILDPRFDDVFHELAQVAEAPNLDSYLMESEMLIRIGNNSILLSQLT